MTGIERPTCTNHFICLKVLRLALDVAQLPDQPLWPWELHHWDAYVKVSQSSFQRNLMAQLQPRHTTIKSIYWQRTVISTKWLSKTHLAFLWVAICHCITTVQAAVECALLSLLLWLLLGTIKVNQKHKCQKLLQMLSRSTKLLNAQLPNQGGKNLYLCPLLIWGNFGTNAKISPEQQQREAKHQMDLPGFPSSGTVLACVRQWKQGTKGGKISKWVSERKRVCARGGVSARMNTLTQC